MAKIKEAYTGSQHGRLTVLKEITPVESNGRTRRFVLCRCSCGNKKACSIENLGKTVTSCGCYRAEQQVVNNTKHGHYVRKNGKRKPSRESRTYWAMRARCLNENHPKYHCYGARGIKICARWLEPKGKGFENFINDMGPKPEGMTLERKNNEKGYDANNCAWATRTSNNKNRRPSSQWKRLPGRHLVKRQGSFFERLRASAELKRRAKDGNVSF
jgi:hypothetical protein